MAQRLDPLERRRSSWRRQTPSHERLSRCPAENLPLPRSTSKFYAARNDDDPVRRPFGHLPAVKTASPVTTSDLPSYERPPVIEVVCGVQFEPLEILMTHLGLLWQQFPDYPSVTEVAPLIPVIEKFGEEQALRLRMTDVPPMARTWFVHRDETGIVQVQKDRFLHNWKKVRESDDYPRFTTVIGLFRDRLATFEGFLRSVDLGDLRPTQYELTYVNHIPQGQGWETMADFGALVPGLATSRSKTGFLPDMESCNLRAAYLLPERHGRLHATIRTATAVEDKKPVVVLELTARGFPGTADRDGMWRWFDLAHEWIVRGFSDLTSPEVQKAQWRRAT